jgi:uncharacterized delta-60 repeat protein
MGLEPRQLLAGFPDAFGQGSGVAVLDVFPGLSEGEVAAPLPDGKVMVAATPRVGGTTLVRLNHDGTIDTTFGHDGRAPGAAGMGSASQVLPLPDGRFLVVGSTPTSYYSYTPHYALARYNADGTPDASFGQLGLATAASGAVDMIGAAVVLPDGSVVAVGTTKKDPYGADSTTDFALARLTPTGQLDTTFGTGGVVVTDVAHGGDWALCAAVTGDGRILVGGTSEPRTGQVDSTIARYLADGRLDTSFHGDGLFRLNLVVPDGIGAVHAVAVAADGRIVVAGDDGGSPSLSVARLTADGQLDTSFGPSGGVVRLPRAEGQFDLPNDLVVLPGGAIIVGG